MAEKLEKSQLEMDNYQDEFDNQEEMFTLPQNKEILSQSRDDLVKNLYDSYKRGRLQIQPDFQRNFVWDKKKSSKLIESAIMQIPLPVIYLAEERDGKTISVIDGQQRLTSFFSYIDGKFPDGSEFKLDKIQCFPELENKSFAELEEHYQDRINECTLRTITFTKNSDPNLKYDIFERLNTGAMALNDQEIRNCIFRGKYNKLIHKLAANDDFKSILGIEGQERRMLDVELVLRFCAFLNITYLKYKSPMKRFLNEEINTRQNLTDEEAEKIEKSFKNSVFLVKSLLGEKAFRRYMPGTEKNQEGCWELKKINVSLYDVLMYCFADIDKNLVMRHLDAIREGYIDLMTTDAEFIDVIIRSTSSKKAVTTRFDKWRKRLEEIIGGDQPQDRCFKKELKQALFDKDPTCAICMQQISHIDDAAVDHIEQYWLGGKTVPENARLTHRYCNCARSRHDVVK